jgi:hypothetical protein
LRQGRRSFFGWGDKIEVANDARLDDATAAVVLGGDGIFFGALDGGASLAAAVVVGNRDFGVCFCGVLVPSETRLA